MRYRYGIPLTAALFALASWAGWVLDVNLVLFGTLVTAAAFAWDARRLGLRRYRGLMGQPPGVVAIITFLAWPLAFPAYLSLRRKVVLGSAEERTEADRRISPAWAVAVVAFIALQLGAMWWRSPLAEEAEGLRRIARDVAMAGVRVNRTTDRLDVYVAAELAADSASRRRIAEDMARTLVARSEPGARLGEVLVIFIEQETRGSVTQTREVTRFSWSAGELARQEKDRLEIPFTLELDGQPGAAGACRVTGRLRAWGDSAEVFGHGTALMDCGATEQPGRAFLRFGAPSSAAGGAGRLDLGLQGPGPGNPCARWGSCSCPLDTGWGDTLAVELSCAVAPDGVFQGRLRLGEPR